MKVSFLRKHCLNLSNMWVVISMILVFSGGVTSNNEQCERIIEEGCNPRQLPSDFPRTADDLEAICRITLHNANCTLNLYQACNLNQDRVNYIRGIVDFLAKECDPQRRLFRAISRDLECMESAIPSIQNFCYERYISEMWKRLATAHLKALYRTGYNDQDTETCVNGIWEDACTAMTIGEKCRTKTADAVLEFLLRMDYRIMACQDDIIYEMPAFIDALSLSENDEDNRLYPIHINGRKMSVNVKLSK